MSVANLILHPSCTMLNYFQDTPGVLDYQYCDLWSSRYTWGYDGKMPEDGDLVSVDSTQTLFIDVDTPILVMLLINGTTLSILVDVTL